MAAHDKKASCELGGQKNRAIYNVSVDLAKGGRKLEKQEKAEGRNRLTTQSFLPVNNSLGTVLLVVGGECKLLRDGATLLQAPQGII